MSADQLIDRFCEHEIADLRANVDALGFLTCYGVPKADGTISRSTA